MAYRPFIVTPLSRHIHNGRQTRRTRTNKSVDRRRNTKGPRRRREGGRENPVEEKKERRTNNRKGGAGTDMWTQWGGKKGRKEGRIIPRKRMLMCVNWGCGRRRSIFFRFHHFFPVKVGRLKERSPLPLPPRIFREEEDREGRKKKEQIGLSDKKCLETRCHTANVRLYNGKEGGLFVLSPPSSSPHSSSSPLLIEGPPLLVNWMDLPPPCSHKTARKMGHDYCLAHMGIQ